MSALAVTDTTSSPLSSPSPGPSTQEAPESEQNPSVSCLHHLFFAFIDDLQSRSGFYESGNALITGGTFVVNRRNQEVTSTPGPTPPTVSDHAPFTIVVDNYMLFRQCLQPLFHYHPIPGPLIPALARKKPRNQNEIPL